MLRSAPVARELAILVDYDNIEVARRRRGPTSIVVGILSSIGLGQLQTAHASVRFYGGWTQRGALTPRAVELSVEIAREFPLSVPLGPEGAIAVRAELALALLADPVRPFGETFRQKGRQSNLQFLSPDEAGCTRDGCAMLQVSQLMCKKRCLDDECGKATADFVVRNEQKGVDAMLMADMFYVATIDRSPLVVVTSDDDLWPAIRMTLSLGCSVTQVQTRPEPPPMTRAEGALIRSQYRTINLE